MHRKLSLFQWREMTAVRTALLLRSWLAFGLLALACFAAAHASAQDETNPEPEETLGWSDPFGRDTPRGAVRGFLESVDQGELERAAEYLDLRNLPKKVRVYSGPELAEGLGQVLERAVWVDFDELSDRPDGEPGDGLPSYRDELARVETATGEIQILLQRIPAPEGEFIWKFSNATIARLPELYAEYRYSPYVEWLSQHIPDVELLGVELFKWVTTLSAALLAYPFVLLITWWIARTITRPDSEFRQPVRRFLMVPVAALIIMLFAAWTMGELGLGVTAQRYYHAGTMATLLAVWVMLSAMNLGRDVYADHLSRRERTGTAVLLRPLTNALKTIIVLLALLVWLENIGLNITTLLAGLGIGGIAVALVLQKPLEDIFGAITLYTQQPIKLGDFMRLGDFVGTVEEINLRATRIRTLDNTVIAIPNAKLAGDAIENISARQSIRYNPNFQVRYDTSADQLRYILLETRKLLHAHAAVVQPGHRVRLTELGTYGFEFAINAYIDTTDFAYYLSVSEDLNLRLADIVCDAGTTFAVPEGQRAEPPLTADPDRRRTAEAAVAARRAENADYPFELPEEEMDALAGSIPAAARPPS
jgi:MscS family membrane protein